MFGAKPHLDVMPWAAWPLIVQTSVMVVLTFPEDRVVGLLDWLGAWSADRGLVLATGQVEVPDDQEISLRLMEVTSTERHGDTWQASGDAGPVDIDFLTRLAPTALTSLTLGRVTPGSYPAVAHLAPGLRSVHLSWSELTDDLLPHLAQLIRLESLQTYGNFFTDDGVQVLSSLTGLVSLCLEEETLTAAALSSLASCLASRALACRTWPSPTQRSSSCERRCRASTSAEPRAVRGSSSGAPPP